MALVYLNKLRGVRVQEAGVDLANAGRVLGLNFSDSALTYDPATGYVTIVSGGTPSGAPTCSTSLVRSVDAEFGFEF